MWFFDNAAKIFLFVIIMIICTIIIQQIYFHFKRWMYLKNYKFRGQHVFITGGSLGLGKCLACRLAREGAKITIIARRESILKDAKQDIEHYAQEADELDVRVQYFCADVTKEDQLRKAVEESEHNFGPIDFLITSHGISIPKYIFETTEEEIMKVMNINYFGTLNTFRSVVPLMMKRNQGEILSITSELSLCGFIGYAHYCPTKFAIRGLVDVMRNELSGYNIKIHCAYPPNMNTQGFEAEQKTKPEEGKAIESWEKTYEADECAEAIIKGIKRGENHLSCGDFGCNMLIRAVIGINQRDNMVADILLMPIIIPVLSFLNWRWRREVKKEKYLCNKARWFAGITNGYF